MIKVSGSSDDLIEVEIVKDGKTACEEEYDSDMKDTLFKFGDGTKLRMHYCGFWKAIVEERGTAWYTIEPLIKYDDHYSDLFTIDADIISSHWKE